MTWEDLYNLFGIKEFIYFISSPVLQEQLLPIKLVCFGFTLFFLVGVFYFMINSSWLQYKFLEDATEFFAWQSYGAKQISKSLEKIRKKLESGSETESKLAIIEAEDLLMQVLDERGYDQETFEESIKAANRLMTTLMMSQVQAAHQTRNSIVYNPDFKLSPEQAKNVLSIYEAAINAIGIG